MIIPNGHYESLIQPQKLSVSNEYTLHHNDYDDSNLCLNLSFLTIEPITSNTKNKIRK